MKTGTSTERTGSLVIELAARTAIIDGRRLVLPPMEFSLLAALAARPGEVVELKELMTVAFGESAAMTTEDLHTRIWRLRRLVGDKDRQHKLVANRRGVGYLVDLPPAAVQVIEGVAETAAAESAVIHLDEPAHVEQTNPPPDAPAVEGDAAVPPPRERVRPRSRIKSALAVALTAAIALAGSWIAGYTLSQRGVEVAAEKPPADQITVPEDQRGSDPDGRQKDKEARNKKERKDAGTTDSADATNPAGSTGSSGAAAPVDAPATDSDQDPKGGSGGGKDKRPPPPPQPDLTLYHLHDPDTGDHFVTTSSSVANQKQAQGYTSTVEGKVFSSQQKGTAAIALDAGTAYVYKSRTSVPEGVSVTELYRLTKDGDLFYTTSSSVANQAEAQGWSRSIAGYVQ